MADPNHVRALVHAGDVTMRHAFAYYDAYRFEHSKIPADDMLLDEVVDLAANGRHVTFIVFLQELIKAVQAGFREVLLVGHGHVTGLAMPLGVPQVGSADRDGLRLARKMEEILARVATIKAMPNPQERLKAWRTLLTELDGKQIVPKWRFGSANLAPTDPTDDADAEKTLHTIAPQVAGESMLKNAELLQVLALRKQVLGLGLKRLEIRACNMGQDPDGMKELREFIGVGRLLAPVVKTFFSSPLAVSINTDAGFKAMIRRNVPRGALAVTSPTRWFTYGPAQALAKIPAAVNLPSVGARAVGVVSINLRQIMASQMKGVPDPAIIIRFAGRTVFSFAWGKTATDNTWVRLFVKDVLDLEGNLNYSSGTFFMAGFDALEGRTKTNPPPAEAHNKAIVLPADPEYRDLIRENR